MIITNPAELVRDAVAALESCEADPVYEIDIGQFHTRNKEGTRWNVCLAGAWMAKRHGLNRNANHLAQAGEFSSECFALDTFRQGSPRTAFWHLRIPHPRHLLRRKIEVRDYKDSPAQFKRDLLGLADYLENVMALGDEAEAAEDRLRGYAT